MQDQDLQVDLPDPKELKRATKLLQAIFEDD